MVTGLTKNDIVIGAEITANGARIGAQGKPIDRSTPTLVSLNLTGPFDAKEIVGELSVSTNIPLIAKRARDAALVTTFSLAAQAAVIGILVLILVY